MMAGSVNAPTASSSVDNVMSSSTDTEEVKLQKSLQKTINAQATYTVAKNFSSISKQINEMIKDLTLDTFKEFKKKSQHLNLDEGEFCLSVEINGVDIDLIPPGVSVNLETLEKYRGLITNALEEFGTTEDAKNAKQNLTDAKTELVTTSGTTVDQVNHLCDNSENPIITDILTITSNDTMQIKEMKGRIKDSADIKDMTVVEMNRLLKNEPKNISDSERNQLEQDAKNNLKLKLHDVVKNATNALNLPDAVDDETSTDDDLSSYGSTSSDFENQSELDKAKVQLRPRTPIPIGSDSFSLDGMQSFIVSPAKKSDPYQAIKNFQFRNLEISNMIESTVPTKDKKIFIEATYVGMQEHSHQKGLDNSTDLETRYNLNTQMDNSPNDTVAEKKLTILLEKIHAYDAEHEIIKKEMDCLNDYLNLLNDEI